MKDYFAEVPPIRLTSSVGAIARVENYLFALLKLASKIAITSFNREMLTVCLVLVHTKKYRQP